MENAHLRAASLAVACALLAACSSQSQRSSASKPQAALTNPTDFPLAAGAVVLDVKPFSQTIDPKVGSSSEIASASGTYSGEEVLAETTETDADLRAWLEGLKKSPPAGYEVSTQMPSRADRSLSDYGIAYAAFMKTGSPNPHGVMVVVMDPKLVTAKVGFVADLVEKYRDLPESMRKPIDDEIKSKMGISATEATDPSGPLGMTLGALQQLGTTQDRAIVMVDATKK